MTPRLEPLDRPPYTAEVATRAGMDADMKLAMLGLGRIGGHTMRPAHAK
jgi:hypothetical protein